MINRRILIFALVGVLVLSAVALISRMNSDDSAEKDDDFEIISSDDRISEIVEEDGLRQTVMYFQNSEGYLVPVMRKLPWSEGIAKSTLMNMVEGPEISESLSAAGLKAIIPSGTQINGMTIDENGLCKVDFTQHILSKENQEEEENLIKGIVYTLTEFPTIREVQVSVDGKLMDKMAHGTQIGSNLKREDINLVDEGEGRSKVVVYYKASVDGNEHYIPVTVPTMAPMANVYTALDVLFEGPPQGSNLVSDIPSNVTFQTVDVHDGTAYVDIELGEDNPLTKEATIDSILKNVGLTLGEFEEVSSIELVVDGEMINSAVPVFANEY